MNNRDMFSRVHTAVATPFTANGELDWSQFKLQLERQISGGVQGIVAVGTTGESPTLELHEHIEVIAQAVKIVRGRALVIAGTGANSTKEAIALTKAAEDVGADASLQVVPYYNKPSQKGLFQHFLAITNATRLPIILYNIPGRTGVDMVVDTVRQLALAASNIIGIKEASGSCDRVTELRQQLGEHFVILCGDDSLTLPFMSVGADGVISVVSNVVPEMVVAMVNAIRECRPATARELHARLYPLTKALFAEGNPAGMKEALLCLGLDTGHVRLPLVGVSEATSKAIQVAMRQLKPL